MNGLPSAKRPFVLEECWKAGLSKRDGQSWQKPLTQKERGQLKMLANALGSETHAVIDYALANWAKISLKAESAAGLSTSPSEPKIGFLLAHYDVVVKFMKAEEERLAQIAAAREAAISAAQSYPEAELRSLRRGSGERDEQGRLKYNGDGDEIYYPTEEELSRIRSMVYAR